MAWRLLCTTHFCECNVFSFSTRIDGFLVKNGRLPVLSVENCPITDQSTSLGTTRYVDDFSCHLLGAGVCESQRWRPPPSKLPSGTWSGPSGGRQGLKIRRAQPRTWSPKEAKQAVEFPDPEKEWKAKMTHRACVYYSDPQHAADVCLGSVQPRTNVRFAATSQQVLLQPQLRVSLTLRHVCSHGGNAGNKGGNHAAELGALGHVSSQNDNTRWPHLRFDTTDLVRGRSDLF